MDFAVVKGGEPLLLVECKWGDAEPDPSLRYLRERVGRAEAWQVSATGKRDFVTPDDVRVAPATKLLARLV